ncbi:GNAT family N-acetyltransferase [Fictibacillus iocasae]|uniref:GNAT family N-acetyltransferase n=1 Tax=Fictibacillus iocasae TaxID=2715437 RepID=A0ABW2NLC4_9BACL
MKATYSVQLQFYQSIYEEKLQRFHLPPEQLPFTAHPSLMLESNEKKRPIVITYNSEPVGFFVLHRSERVSEYSQNSRAMLLTAFSINHTEQGKGFALRAMNQLSEFSRKMYPFCNEIVLAVNKRNIPAQRLYEKAGFLDTGRRKTGKIGEQLIMSLILQHEEEDR